MRFRSRTAAGEATGSAATVLVDWFGDSSARTVSLSGGLAGLADVSSLAGELFRFAGAVYLADRVAPRAGAADRWTRDLRLEIGFSDPAPWLAVSADLAEALSFLSGDRWELRIRRAPRREPAGLAVPVVDAVCLFSGGLDSLCGAIDLLERGSRVLLIGHYEGGQAPGVQRALARALADHYGADRAELRQLHLAPAPTSPQQQRPLPDTRENTTRARSLLFILVALGVATQVADGVPVHVPENGFIGINVPLRRRRSGSHSTRTTHPWFMDRLQKALDRLDVEHPIANPYRLKTKGEVVAESANPALLGRLRSTSISCAHPEWARWRRRPQGNCGFCFPCLIRRSALHASGFDDPRDYAFDALGEDLFLDRERDSGANLRALIASLRTEERPLDVVRNGPVPDGERRAFRAVHQRARAELRTWIEDRGSVAVRRELGG